VRGSVIAHLILKDWRLHRLQISLTVVVGLLALAVLQHGGEVPFVLGSVWYFVATIVLGSMLPFSAIVNERKKQTLAFLMSLPLTSIQYTTAKVVSTLASVSSALARAAHLRPCSDHNAQPSSARGDPDAVHCGSDAGCWVFHHLRSGPRGRIGRMGNRRELDVQLIVWSCLVFIISRAIADG
jgi:ABC-2 family transporter protein